MNKNGILIIILSFLLIMGFGLSSAYDSKYYESNSYKKVVTTEEKSTQTVKGYWGTKKISTFKKEQTIVEVKDNRPLYTYHARYPVQNPRYSPDYSRMNYNMAYNRIHRY